MSTREGSASRQSIERVLSRALLPVGLAATLAITLHTLVTRASHEQVFRVMGPVMLVTLSALELWVGRWRPSARALPRDALFLVLGGVMDTIGRMAAALVAIHLGGRGFGDFGRVPLWLSIPIGLIVADGVAYAMHRVSHVQPLLWRIHALHHFPRELYALMSTVNGPLVVLLIRGLPLVALVALGFPAEVVFVYSMLDTWVGLVSHTGVDTHNPWITAVLVSPETHRLHHGSKLADAGNYALLLTFWDRLLGTWVPPRNDGRAPSVGLAEPELLPATWTGVLLLQRPASAGRDAARTDDVRV
ncbi:Sterol desaturase [Minicystis rosea]|nr:Sterol desaturase [Minicystis rosea]